MKKEKYRMYVGMFIATIISALFFCLLNQYNNKYTQHATQAINGLLVLSEADMKDNSYRFLWNDWIYYPGALLTPDDFAQGDPDRYMTYVDINASNRMEFDVDDTQTRYGCGTYVLHCKLPSGISNYALDLPEIFSAYHLYINGEKLLSIGNPDPSDYQDATGNRLVTFSTDENGMATIIIAVNNQSYIYSGMTYPPTLGTAVSLNYLRGIRLGLRLCVIFSFFIAAALSLYWWRKTHHPNAPFFFFLCIFMIGWTSYPLLHTILILPVFPCYLLEVLSCYLTLLLLVMMQNRICETPQTPARISSGIAALFCVGIVLYLSFSKYLSDDVLKCISAILTIYKLILAAYLLATSCIAVRKNINAKQLLYVSVFFACACIFDRIFPEYDPIFGGWFLEWICILLVCVVGCILWRFLTENYTQNLLLNQQHHHMEKQLIMQTNYTHQLNEQMEERRRFVHDFRQHLRVLHTMAEHSNNPEILQYLDSVTEYSVPSSSCIQNHSGNPAVDALLYYYQCVAETKCIQMNIQFILPKQLLLTDVELCTMLGNLLENAVEACRDLPESTSRCITVKTAITKQSWYMTMENTFDGTLRQQDNFLFRTKKSNAQYHGIGLSSVSHIVRRYHGTLDLLPYQKIFRIGIRIPLCK